MGRIIIFTGKGGVGKTSIAAAHAVRAASEGKKTLLVSADMAPNLGDIFETEVGGNAVPAGDNLYLLELDPDQLVRENYPNISKAMRNLFGSSGLALDNLDDEMIIPGFENLFSLLKIRDIYNSGEYDLIIVDCAPTGETLSLLKLPELLSWYMEKFYPVGKTMVRVMAPVSKAKYKVTLPNRKAMNEIEQMHWSLVALQELLKDPDVSSVRLVCTPGKMVVDETKRSYMYLNLYHYQVDGVFINRILPDDAGSDFMNHWGSIQKKYIRELESVFAGIPITRIAWYPHEVRGRAAIQHLCDDVLGDKDILNVRVHTDNEIYEACDGGWSLTIRLPGAAKEDVTVYQHEMDVNIKVNNFNRCIPLPNTLTGAQIDGWDVADGFLRIQFSKKADGQDETAEAGKDGK